MTRDHNNLPERTELHANQVVRDTFNVDHAQMSKALASFFSEYALVKNSIKVEIMWLQFLLENVEESTLSCSLDKSSSFDWNKVPKILNIYENFSESSFGRIKELEAVTNSDKSVDLFIAEELKEMGLGSLERFVHVGCNSENIANAFMISNALFLVWIPAAKKLIEMISNLSTEYAMMSHSQIVNSTTLGKEFAIYAYRLNQSLEHIESCRTLAKFNGANDTYDAISKTFPNEDWIVLSKVFVESYLGLKFNPITTEIESHDYFCHIADAIRHFNNVLLSIDINMWIYISKEYFKQITVKEDVTSSKRPYKVFENNEATIDMSNAILMTLSNKLPCSRMPKNLFDSFSQKNIALAFSYSLQAIEQTIKDLSNIVVNKEKISS